MPPQDLYLVHPEAVTGHKRLKLENGHTVTSIVTSNSPQKQKRFRDYVWAYAERYLAMEEAAVMEAESMTGNQDGARVDEMKLVQQLISCAEAVACRDRTHASALLAELRPNALMLGTSFQRVASCFVQGLSDRLQQVQPLGAVGLPNRALTAAPPPVEREEALRLAYQICPQLQFAHFVANASILEALEGESSSVHIIDIGVALGPSQGQQWRKLIHDLSQRGSKPAPRISITFIGNSKVDLEAIQADVGDYAKQLETTLELQLRCIHCSLENLRPEQLQVREGETVIINSVMHLHCVVKESRGALSSVLRVLHQLSPKLLVLVEQDSSHNGPFFLGRFMEALHYYSALFDSLDATLPRYDTRRAKIEQFYYAEEIKNIVSCEGYERVERHERADQWRRRMSRAGFQSIGVKLLAPAKEWLGKVGGGACEGYTVTEEKGCLVLGWKSRPIVAASCWKGSSS